MKNRRSKIALTCAALGLGVCVWAGLLRFGQGTWSEDRVVESQRRAAPIIAALEAHYADHKAFPPNLDALVPRYLKELPRPTAGTGDWYYRVRDESFALSFGCGSDHYPNCTYSSGSRNWMIDH